MKLCFVHEGFGTFGGAEGNVRQTAGELSRRGHSLGLIHGPALEQDQDASPHTFSRCFELGKNHNRGQVEAALKDFNPDLVYVHRMTDLEVVETLVASETPRVRMVHDHDIYCMRSYKYHYFSRKICTRRASPYCVFPCGASIGRSHNRRFPIKWVSYKAKKREISLNQRFQRLVVYSEYSRKELLSNGFDGAKIEIHVPIQSEEADSMQSSFSDRNLLLFVGQVIRGKGVDVLLDSLAMIKTPFECLIIGEGSHRAYCEKRCRKLGLENRVRFTGFIPQHELKKYYPECSVLAMSSVWPEPFGMVGPEAMRFGIPVVAFDVGGIREWLKDGFNGYLVPWMDRAAFAARIEELLINKKLGRQMGEHGRRWVAQTYDFRTYITGLERMFMQVILEKQQGILQ
ncbi:MAG: hypothetical protein JWR26_1947 [Pedosphaera sp.]|nr:hypothetical protein [Pedosphaera sp.]